MDKQEVIAEELLINGQKVDLKNPGTKALGDFLKLSRSMSKIPQDQPERFMEYLDDAAIDASVRLINMTLEKTFPTMNEDERGAWGLQNSFPILMEIIKMCSPKDLVDKTRTRVALMEKIKDAKQPSQE